MTTQTQVRSTDEALKLALEQIKAGSYECAIDRLEEALAQSEQEPVAWTEQRFYDDGTPNPCSALKWAGRNAENDFPVGTKLYTIPPQRKPLTDEEIAKIASTPAAVVGSYVHTFARAIEAAHGIKE